MKNFTLLIALSLYSLNLIRAQDPVTYEPAFPNLSFEYPAEIQNAKDGSDRLFVVEQSGRIKVFQNTASTTQQQVFLDVRNEINFSVGQEIGLLGLAFHPDYSQNGYFYVYHTRSSSIAGIDTEMVLARYQVSSDVNRALASSRVEIFSFDKNQEQSNHNGGKIAFGPDGYLYVSIGDGGGGGDPEGNGQNLNTIFGSIIRIDVDVNGDNPLENNPDAPNGMYEIPSDNPRVGQSGLDELYAWGIRNTWKFSFDNVTNRLWGADVGQATEEEINIIENGGNYGWRRYEGTGTYSGNTSLVTSPDIKPVFRYPHSNGDLSITGGYVYRGSSTNTTLQGKYVYGDYVSGRVWALDYNGGTASSSLLFRTNGLNVSSFGLDETGELYFSSYGSSANLYKIVGGNEPTGPTTIAVNGIGSWKDLENGTNGIIEAVATQGDDIYVGGTFSTAGGTSAVNIAHYNKNSGWENLSSGANGSVFALEIASDGKLYAGGSFTSIGGVAAQNIAVWNGSTWAALNSGINGMVAKIGIDGNDNVYVGGAFITAGGISVNNIALWSGGNWAALTDSDTSVAGTNNEIRAIAFDTDNTLYVGGNFDSAGGRTANRIATWNGRNWSTLGSGTSGFVQAIVVTGLSVYAGGNFVQAGGITVNRVARWLKSSNTWNAMGNGLSGNVNALDFDGTYLYAGGSFETAANLANTDLVMNGMARWSVEQAWQALGTGTNVGTNNLVNDFDLSDSNDRLYVGGNFIAAGNVSASEVAVWSPRGFDCTDETLIVEYRINGTWSSGQATITVDEGTDILLSLLPNDLDFTITSPSGITVTGDYDLGNISEYNAGIYTYRTTDGCETTLTILVNSTNPCNAERALPEYRIENGPFISGERRLVVDKGTTLTLGITDDISFIITLPNGSTVNGDYTISNIQSAEAGTYTFTTGAACTATFEIAVIDDGAEECSPANIIQEYRINGVWDDGLDTIDVPIGTEVVLSMLPNDIGVTITLPNGEEVGDDYNLGEVTAAQSGVYKLTSQEGCSANLQLNVIDDSSCQSGSIIPEYQIDDEWSSGRTSLNLAEGTALTLSILPNSIDVAITLPNGSIVGDNYNLGNVTVDDEGLYLFETPDGCTTSLTLGITGDFKCAEDSVINEYRIDGIWESGNEVLRVPEGTDVVLSMLPNEVPVTITTPEGQEFGDDYSLGSVTVGQSGTYLLRTDEGCVNSIELIVTSDIPCAEGVIIPEYRLDGVWLSGDAVLTIDEGTDVVLSMLPNNIDLAITTPDGNVMGDDFRLGNINRDQGGVYTLDIGTGCTQTITLNVNDAPNCDADSVIPQYSVDGVQRTGSNYQRMVEGSEISISIVNADAGTTITLPDGRIVGNTHVIENYTMANNGLYILTTSQGCKTTLELYAPRFANSSVEEFTISYSDVISLSAEEGVGEGIRLFPNPTTAIVMIDVGGFSIEGFSLTVANIGQQQLMTQDFGVNHPEQISVDLSGYSSGIYFLNFKRPDGSAVTLRVIKD